MKNEEIYMKWICVWKDKHNKYPKLPTYAWSELMERNFLQDSGTCWYEYREDDKGEFIKEYYDGNQSRKVELLAIWRKRK